MGKGASQNMGYQMGGMGGKGGMQQQPPNMFGGMQSQFTGTGQPAQQPTQQPTTQPAIPSFVTPRPTPTGQLDAASYIANRMPRPRPGGFFQPTPMRPDPFQNFMQRRNDFVNSDNDLNTIRYQQMVLEDKMRRQQAAQQPAAPADMTAADMNANMTAEGADPAMAQPQPPAFDEGMMNQMDMLNQQYMNRLNQSPFGRPMGRFGPFGRFPGMGGKGVRRPLFGRFGPTPTRFGEAALQGGSGFAPMTEMQRGTTPSNRLGQLFGLASGMTRFPR